MRMIYLVAALLAGILSNWLSAAPAEAATCTTAPCQVVFVNMFGTTIAGNGATACLNNTGSACNNFADALTQVATGGTIIIVDDGSYYESVTVTKSVTIISPLNASIIPPSGSPAFTVATAGVTLEIRGLVIDGIKGGTAGISATTAASVRIRDTLIKNFTGGGIIAGVNVKPAAGTTIIMNIENSQLRNNSFGVVADGTGGGIIRGDVVGSALTTNANNGITVATTTTSVVLSVDNTIVTGNNFGLVAAGANAGMLVGRTNVTTNNTGLNSTSGGALISYKNNNVNANFTADGTFTSSITPQ
jgi:hypothetical protein